MTKQARFNLKSVHFDLQIQRIDPAIQLLEEAITYMIEDHIATDEHIHELVNITRNLVDYRNRLFVHAKLLMDLEDKHNDE